MAIKTPIRTATLAALIVGAGLTPMGAAQAADPAHAAVIQVAASEATSRFLPLGIGNAVVVDLPRDIKDVLVADPTTANAVIRTSRRAYLIGMKAGRTNILFFDAEGQQIGGYDIAVTREVSNIRALLKRMLPDADITIEELGQSLVLSGTVATPVESQLAYDIAVRLVGTAPGIISTSNTAAEGNGTRSTQTTGSAGDSNVVNALTIRGRDQVMLKVTVAEVQRNVIKQLGIDLNGTFNYGAAVVNFNTKNPFSATGAALNTGSPITGAWKNVTATVQAMERAGVIRTLAEPNLTAISGETASFLAGGEFPIVTGTSGPPTYIPMVEFKKFGVSLIFTPVVLAEGRISLKVMTEISELSTEGALSVAGGISIPSLKTRRAETTVEIPSGGSLALAGMIQEQTKQAINGTPGLMQLPILGALFKSRDYTNNQTELMVMVTPYVVRAVAQKQLSRPDDGFADPNDQSSILLGRLNRIYGAAGQAKTEQPSSYHGKYGFILD